MSTRSIRAWAVINKNLPIIDIQDIYDNRNDVILEKHEKFIRVEITEIEEDAK